MYKKFYLGNYISLTINTDRWAVGIDFSYDDDDTLYNTVAYLEINFLCLHVCIDRPGKGRKS